jgi:hypothetical protein
VTPAAAVRLTGCRPPSAPSARFARMSRARETARRTLLPDVDAKLSSRLGTEEESAELEDAYAALRPADFSREILERGPGCLAVLPVCGVLWSDWGTPERVVETLRRVGTAPPWLEAWLARSA